MAKHDILFIPGPVEVRDELRQIMAMPLIGHRSKQFVAMVEAVRDKLRPLFLTEAHTLFENCPATALMEASIRNLVNDRVLHLSCGAFGERWAKISEACGRTVTRLAANWGEPNTPEALRAELEHAASPYEAVAITHSETSTGVLNDVAGLAAVVREVSPETMIVVDVVTSVGGAEFRFDDWGIDVAFAGTQKCLALPPGLCVYAVSERALARAATIPGRGFLLDFVTAQKGMATGKPPATPCVPLVFALARQLDDIAAEGIEARWHRHLKMRDMTLQWAEEQGFVPLVLDSDRRAPTVTTLRASGRDVPTLIERAKAAGFVLGNGYGKLKNETFRIGHMGDHRPDRLRDLLTALS